MFMNKKEKKAKQQLTDVKSMSSRANKYTLTQGFSRWRTKRRRISFAPKTAPYQ